MSRVVVTSVVRYAAAGEIGGYFRVLDLERGGVTFVAPVPDSLYRHVDPNPRGGLRGGRGVSAYGDRLAIANTERLFVFDFSWMLVEDATHPLAANIHELHAGADGVWVTATGCDSLLLVGWDGSLLDRWSFRDDEQLVSELGLPASMPPFDPSRDYRDPRGHRRTHTIHLNAVAPGSDGLLLSFGRIHSFLEADGGESAIVRLEDGHASILDCRPAPGVPNHNVAEDGDRLVFNDSNRGVLVAHDWRRGDEVSAVPVPGSPSFARGLARIGPGLWLVGSQEPLAVYAIDLDHGELVAEYRLDGVENETVFAISPLPDVFEDPPPSGDDPFAFWRQAAPGKGMTPVPQGITPIPR